MDELLERICELAGELAFEHFDGPPVDPRLIAERLGISIATTDATAHWVADQGAATIYLPRDGLPERLRFTIAHEILEIQGSRLSPPFPIERELSHRAEWLFQLGASELLMPRRWFEEAGGESGWHLAHLRGLFEVSWEAAARRVPACIPAICTITDNGVITTRVGSQDIQFPRQLAPAEHEAITAAYDAWPSPEPRRRRARAVRCDAWPALPERNSIRRVCLLTYPREE